MSIVGPHRFLTLPSQRRALFDGALVAVVFAATIAMLSHDPTEAGRGWAHDVDPASVGFAAASAAPLAAWRRFPHTAFTLTTVAAIALAAQGSAAPLLPGPFVALFLLASGRDQQTPWTWRGTALVVGLFTARLTVTGLIQQDFPGTAMLHTGLAWAVAWFAGERARLRREQVAELADRAHRTQRQAQRDRLLAVAEERARIARDLHDSAGHAISVIALRAGAARIRHHHDDSQRCLAALHTIEQVARQTATEIDHMVGTLRDGAADTDPIGLTSLGTLIAHHRQTGLELTLTTTGVARHLPAAADQAAYRILQEALRNAARHGTGQADLHVTYTGTAIEFTVTNPLPATGTAQPGGGHGIIGMRERAALLGGTLHTHDTDGAFTLRALIPAASEPA